MKQLRRIAVGALAVLAVVLLLRTGANGWRELRRSDIDVGLAWLALAALFAGLAMAWIAWCWHAVMCALTIPLDRGTTIAAYFVGEIGKYVPGGIWPVVGRGEVARREFERDRGATAASDEKSVGRSVIYRSVILSLAYLFLGGLTLGAVAVLAGWSDVSHGWWLAGLVILPIGFVAITPQGTRTLHRLGSSILRPFGVALPQIEMPSASISAADVCSLRAGVVCDRRRNLVCRASAPSFDRRSGPAGGNLSRVGRWVPVSSRTGWSGRPRGGLCARPVGITAAGTGGSPGYRESSGIRSG